MMARAVLKNIIRRRLNGVGKLKLIMLVRFDKTGNNKSRTQCAAMTMPEVLMALVIMVTVMAGLILGYTQANRMAEFCSMTLAAQSYASQGLEQARSAQWNSQIWPPTNGPGTGDELPPTTNASGVLVPMIQTNTLDIPAVGDPSATNFPFWVTNYITVSSISVNPKLRQIRSDAVWTFPLTGRRYTNSVVTQRAPDE